MLYFYLFSNDQEENEYKWNENGGEKNGTSAAFAYPSIELEILSVSHIYFSSEKRNLADRDNAIVRENDPRR